MYIIPLLWLLCARGLKVKMCTEKWSNCESSPSLCVTPQALCGENFLHIYLLRDEGHRVQTKEKHKSIKCCNEDHEAAGLFYWICQAEDIESLFHQTTFWSTPLWFFNEKQRDEISLINALTVLINQLIRMKINKAHCPMCHLSDYKIKISN